MDSMGRWWKVWKGEKLAYISSNDRCSAARDGEKHLNLPSCTAEIAEVSDEEAIRLGLLENQIIELDYDSAVEVPDWSDP